MDDFTFDYGVVAYKHRFSINRPLDDYQVTTLSKVIRIGLELKYVNMTRDHLVYELQVVYKDDLNKLKCLKLDLKEWTFTLLHLGDIQFNI